ncbi:MAG: 50S ribosomal protein L6 [Flavobacteriales bacterium]
MSRIGNSPIALPQGVSISKGDDNTFVIKGKLGELSRTFHPDMNFNIGDTEVVVERPSDSKEHKSIHGLSRSLMNNMIVGVSEGYKKQLELVGVGYRASNSGQKLELSLGFSHNVIFEIPSEVKVETLSEKGQNPIITLTSNDNQLLGIVAAKIRSLRKPEPYKGKGIKFVGEEIRRKAGKTAAK